MGLRAVSSVVGGVHATYLVWLAVLSGRLEGLVWSKFEHDPWLGVDEDMSV